MARVGFVLELADCRRVVVVVTRPLRRDEGMVEDHGAPEARQLSMSWTRM